MRLGSSRCQCPTCDLYFSATSTFDTHRIWTCGHVRHHKDECWDSRRCLTPPEMKAAGLVFRPPGVWGAAAPENPIWSPAAAPERAERRSA